MIITKITIENYRGVKEIQTIPLSNFTSIVGRNDSGKSIIINAIASYLDPKNFPITESDFNDPAKPIKIECCFQAENLRQLLETKVKTKIKKSEGLDEFVEDLIFDEAIVFQKVVASAKKGFDLERILFRDYEAEEFQMLYNKSDEELTNLITKNGIEVPVEGKGRNSKLEKIKYLKEFCKDKTIITRYLDDDYKVCSLFPEVELFKSDYGLEADTKFRTTSVSEIQSYFERETATAEKKLRQVEKEIEAEMQVEANSIKGYMNDYVSALNNVEIKPVISWKDAIKSVDVNFQFDGDTKPIPMSHKGTGYRRLFMVARFRFLAEKNKGKNITYLIEEPETFLHPSAQEDLLNAFRDLSSDNQIIITTHSPVFAGATSYHSIILCSKGVQSLYEHAETGDENQFIDKVVAELGIKPSYNLKDYHEKILFVESSNDSKFFDIVCQKLFGCGILNNKRIQVLPFGGGEDIESFLNIDYFDSSGRDLYLIIDRDAHVGNEEKQKQRANDFVTKKLKSKAHVLTRSCIENYYHPRCLERVYSLPEGTFEPIKPEDNARQYIKKIISEKDLSKLNIKEKNNFKVFNEMSKDEWVDVIEEDLCKFLTEVLS